MEDTSAECRYKYRRPVQKTFVKLVLGIVNTELTLAKEWDNLEELAV